MIEFSLYIFRIKTINRFIVCVCYIDSVIVIIMMMKKGNAAKLNCRIDIDYVMLFSIHQFNFCLEKYIDEIQYTHSDDDYRIIKKQKQKQKNRNTQLIYYWTHHNE